MGTVVGSWRLKLIIFLVVIGTCIYIVNGFFYGIETDEAGFIVDEENIEVESKEGGDDFISILFKVGDYLSFGNINNIYARTFLGIFISIFWICVGYIIYTFVKEWVPFN